MTVVFLQIRICYQWGYLIHILVEGKKERKGSFNRKVITHCEYGHIIIKLKPCLWTLKSTSNNIQILENHIKKLSYNLWKLQKLLSPLRYNPYFPCLLCIAKGNHQELEGGGGGKALLYSKKSALNVATLAISPSKSCPWAAWVVINISIIARRERGGGTVGSTATLSACTPSSPSSATAVVGSTRLSLGWTSPVVDYTHGLFDEPTLGPKFFFCTLRCLRKVAPIEAMMWINSREGKFSNPKKFRTL